TASPRPTPPCPHSPQLLPPPAPPPTLFPCTTLFRSGGHIAARPRSRSRVCPSRQLRQQPQTVGARLQDVRLRIPRRTPAAHADRSEEHTSELQSREKLVCRPLLEKKKTIVRTNDPRT